VRLVDDASAADVDDALGAAGAALAGGRPVSLLVGRWCRGTTALLSTCSMTAAGACTSPREGTFAPSTCGWSASAGSHLCSGSIGCTPLDLDEHVCVPFNVAPPVYGEVPRSYAELQDYLDTLESRFSPGHTAEGIVFHHPDGRRAKIKRRDFPRRRA
jgi:hypothetical protein